MQLFHLDPICKGPKTHYLVPRISVFLSHFKHMWINSVMRHCDLASRAFIKDSRVIWPM